MSATGTDAVSEPDVPVTVTLAAPVAALLVAVSVSVLEPVAGLVENEAETPLGKPLAVRATAPTKPFAALMVITSVAVLPCVSGTLGDAADKVKVGAGFTAKLSCTCGAAE